MRWQARSRPGIAVIVAAALTQPLPGALAHGGDGAASSQEPRSEVRRVDHASAEEHPFGRAGDPAEATRTIVVDMTDRLRFEPAEIEVERGETIRFVVHNRGRLMHEMVLGTEESLHEHAELMKRFPGMEHDEPHMAHVAPGRNAEMGWRFTRAGEFHFGCLVPGHFDAGMQGRIVVRE